MSRFAASLIALALTGAPRLLAMEAPVAGHVCSCDTHAGEHHECDCVICRRASLTAQASDEKAPPCHRAAARKALSKSESTRKSGAPCIEGTCGGSGKPLVTPAGIEPFCLPANDLPALADRADALSFVLRKATGRAFGPETPPPRQA